MSTASERLEVRTPPSVAIRRAVLAALERYGDDLDAPSLRGVRIDVRMNSRTGLPRSVVVARENEHDVE